MNRMECRVPGAYMPPYLMKGYASYPKSEPLTIPQGLRKSIDMERRKSLPPENAALEASPINWPSIQSALERHRCPTNFPPSEQNGEKVRLCGSSPPPGYSKYYWALKLQGYGRKPDQTLRRRAKFSVWEKPVEARAKKLTFPTFEGYPKPIDVWACSLPPCHMPSIFKQQEVERRVRKLEDDLDSLNLDYAKVLSRIAQKDPYVPHDRVNTGCERLRQLAEIDAEAVYLLVKKFVTGPADKDFSFLKRSEVAECWERIVTSKRKIKPCCVQQVHPERTKPEIPALYPRPLRGQKIIKCRRRGGAAPEPRVPPFLRPIPTNPKLRLPWQLTPFKGRNEPPSSHKSKVYDLRLLNLDDIITQFKDPYGELRLRQREEKGRSLRTTLLHDFLDRTDVSKYEGYQETRQLKMEQLNISPEERKEMLLAAILRHEQSENSVERVYLREQVRAREARIRARAERVDYSQVTSKYLQEQKRMRGFIKFTT